MLQRVTIANVCAIFDPYSVMLQNQSSTSFCIGQWPGARLAQPLQVAAMSQISLEYGQMKR